MWYGVPLSCAHKLLLKLPVLRPIYPVGGS